MRLYGHQSSPGNFLVATRSHSPLPTWPTLVVERIRRECRPSLAWTSVKIISPAPVNDQAERSSMLSSTRELRTFLFSHRNSAPSSYLACMGIWGAICCAVRNAPKQKMHGIVVMLNRRALLTHLFHLTVISMIGPFCLHAITTRPIDLQKLTGLHRRFQSMKPVLRGRVGPHETGLSRAVPVRVVLLAARLRLSLDNLRIFFIRK